MDYSTRDYRSAKERAQEREQERAKAVHRNVEREAHKKRKARGPAGRIVRALCGIAVSVFRIAKK